MPDCREGDFRPPAPHPLESRPGLLDLLFRLKRNPLECWSADFFREPIAKVRLPFVEAFLVHDPQGIKRVLMDNCQNYPKDPIQRRILSAGLSEGLLSAEGQRWAHQRRALAPLFSRRTVTQFTNAMLAVAHRFSGRWKKLGPATTIDIAAEMTLLTLHVLALTIFSDGIGGDFEDFQSAMNSYFGVIGRIDAFDLLNLPSFVPRPGARQLRRTMAYFEGVIDDNIETRRPRLASSAATDKPNDLLTLLLGSLDPGTGRPLGPAEVRSNILTFLSAGHETTANALAWSMFLLSGAPQWRSRVRQEAERVLDRAPPEQLADRLVVTRAVIEEALRLYPPIAALSRTAEQADVLAGHHVKAGSLVVIAPYVLHRHCRLWSRPDVFDPSRFMPEQRGNIPRFAYLPFGVGPRTCIGASFALQEAAIVLAVLTRNFDLRLAPGAAAWPVQKITLRPENGLPMQLSAVQAGPAACAP